jgi:ligand-binding sensor domain-containing protein/AraC-like DNA-binding protein
MQILTIILSALLGANANFRSLPIEESGLNIETICQDSLGRMWFGGADGVVRYDCNRYEHFKNTVGDERDIPDNSVYHIACDSEGTIWVAHIAGLSRYDRESNSFISYPSPSGAVIKVNELSSDRFLTIAGDRLWIFSTATGTFSRAGIPDIVFSQSVSSMERQGEKIFVGTRKGRLFCLDSDLKKAVELDTKDFDNKISCIAQDSQDHIWVGTEGSGLWGIDLKDNKCSKFSDQTTGNDIVKSLCIDKDGALWIGTKNGLKILKNGKISLYKHDNSKPGTIAHDSIGAIYSDLQGTMWLGTYFGGICYHTSNSSSFRHIVLNSVLSKVNGYIISDIVEDNDGSLWIGTNSGGLIRLYPDGSMRQIAGTFDEDRQIDVKSIYISPYSGKIYVGADRSELLIVDSSKRLKIVDKDGPESCYTIEYNKKDGFLVGSQEGLYEYNERTGTFSRIYFTGDNTNIKAIKLDSRGTLWIGKKSGIAAINQDDAKMLELPEELTSIRYAEIIIEDSTGKIWIGSRYGLYCHNPRDGRTTVYSEKDGLPDHVIHGIEEDKNGILWISTDKGLCRFDQNSSNKMTFTTSDGLLDNRFTTYAHTTTKNGQICFGSINGIVMFDPDNISIERPTTSPVICGIEINGAWSGIPEKKVTLAPSEQCVTFLFSSPDYVSEKNGSFYYILEGLDKTWNKAGLDWKATYPNLPHGEYTFKLRYIDSSGKESEKTESIHIVLRAYWYKSAVACIIYLMILFFSIIFLINWLVSRKEKKYKDKMEDFKNKVLQDFSLEFININTHAKNQEAHATREFDESDEKFMRNAMQTVKDNMDNADFSVDYFAEKMFMSRSNLNLKVKALFGVSPLELIKTVRFNEACRLLLEKKHSMTEISEMVGFTTSSYFTSAFKKFMGCTPSDYIKKNN